jgi:NtrC-family two-component system response regulator AlgB
MARVLVVDDEKNIRSTLSVCLEAMGCEVRAAATAEAALREMAHAVFELAFVDLRLGTDSGLDLLPRMLAADAGVAIVMITAYAEVATAVEAVKRGAWDFLPKPFSPAQIRHLVDKLAERRTLTARMSDLESQVPESDFSSRSPRMVSVMETAARVAATDAGVLLRGENGTGKGVLARMIHARSKRADRPFVTVNCPALSEELLASELFGHARGAFTGAVRDQPGRVETAQGGTLFLDEIGDLPPPLQAKLLRVLQDREFERVGESETRRADVRVIAATNSDLEAAVTAGSFRQDLLYRLNVVELRLPALRDRPEDILPLAGRFLAFFGRGVGRHDLGFSPAAEAALCAHGWPGNVRELRNAVERAVILWPARVIDVAAFPDKLAAAGGKALALGGDFTLEQIEHEHVLRVLARTPTLDGAARVLGIDGSTLYRKRKKWDEQ